MAEFEVTVDIDDGDLWEKLSDTSFDDVVDYCSFSDDSIQSWLIDRVGALCLCKSAWADLDSDERESFLADTATAGGVIERDTEPAALLAKARALLQQNPLMLFPFLKELFA